jgi:alpha-beta hydrolase superfamily lysophospholipase
MPVPAYPDARQATRQEGFLHAKDDLRLYWQRYAPPSPAAAVAVLPGGGDHSGRYAALTSALVAAGFQVDLLDFRGHGQSDGRRWHIDAWSDYLGDVDVFLAHVRAGAAGLPVFVVAHSQGGLIAATWGQQPDRGVAGMVLSSPYFRLKLAPPKLKVWSALLVGKIVPWLPVSTGLRYEDLTSDAEMQRWTKDDPMYGKATTPRWFVESQAAQAKLMAGPNTFRYPLLVLAGSDDPIADPDAARTFCDTAASADKAFRLYPGMRHELFNEVKRDTAIGDTVAWIGSHAR